MSETLYNWLNSEIKLSKYITDIPSEFANGYYFGEVLSKFHLLPTFREFKNTMIPLDITRNYSLLEKAFGDISIQLTEVHKGEILSKKKFKAELFLYKIKQRIANKLISLDTLITKGVNEVHTLYKEMTSPTKIDKILYDTTKKRSVQSAKLAPINYNKLATSKRDKKIIREIVDEEEYQHNQHMENNQKIHSLESARHNEEMKKDKTNSSNWTKQMDIKNTFDTKMKEENYNETKFYRMATESGFIQSCHDNQLIVKAFDNNLSRLGLDLKVIDPKMAKTQTKTVTTEIFMERIRQKLELQERSRKDKEKRQRKIASAIIKATPFNTLANKTQTTCITVPNKTVTHFRAGTARFPFKPTKNLPPIVETTQADEQYIPLDIFDKTRFFNQLHKENLNYCTKETIRRHNKRQLDTQLLRPLALSLIELTEICYDYQTQQNTELIDLTEWKKLMQLLIDNQPFNPEEPQKGHNYTSSLPTELNEFNEDQGEDGENRELIENVHYTYTNTIIKEERKFTPYDDETFKNYLFLIGEFINNKAKDDISSIKLDLYDVMGNDLGMLITEKHDFKPTPANMLNFGKLSDMYEPKKEDLEMLQLPTGITHDTFFGDFMKEIIDYNTTSPIDDVNPFNGEIDPELIEEPKEIVKVVNEINMTEVFNSIPMKISFLGNKFAGKETHAKMIAERYSGIKVYDIHKIITGLKEKVDKIDSPIENHPKFKTLKKNQIEQIKKEKMQIEEGIKTFMPLIRQYMNNPTEEVILSILFESIKIDFPLRDLNETIAQIQKRNVRKAQITEEVAKIKEEQIKKPKAKVKEEQLYRLEMEKLQSESYKGFIILNYPNNSEQARLLEFRINQYIQAIEAGKTNNQIEQEELLQMCEMVFEPKQLSKRQCSVDKFICLNTSKDEMIRRGENRKLDPQTGIIYHLTDNPPPEKDKKLNERLQLITEPNREQIISLYDDYLSSFDDIMKFYLNFIISKKELITEQPKEDSSNQIKEILSEMITKYETDLLSPEGKQTSRLDTSLINFNPTNQPKAQAKFQELRSKFPQTAFFLAQKKWKEFTIGYAFNCKDCFINIKELQLEISSDLQLTQAKFIKFLSEKSDKKSIVDLYKIKYRAFCEQYSTLKKHELVKSDFNRDLNELTDRLWEVINERKTLAIDELRSIIANGFIEQQINEIYKSIERLFILETEKLFVIINILSDFFDTREPMGYNIKVAYEVLKNTTKYTIENPGDKNNFPKLERMYKNCIIILFRYSMLFKQKEQILLQKHQIDVSLIKKKKTNKDIRNRMSNTPKIADFRDFDDDLKDSIMKQIALYKYRVSCLKFFGEKTLIKIRSTVDTLYSTMDEWIIISIKQQNETMNQLISNLRRTIGTFTVIEERIELDDFTEYYETINLDINVDSNIRLENKPMNEGCSLTVFFKVNELLKQYEISHNVITVYLFNELFVKGYLFHDLNKKLFTKKLQTIDFHHYSKFQSFFLFYSNEINPNLLSSIEEETNEDKIEVESLPESLVMTNALLTILLLIHCSKMREDEGEDMLNDNKDKIYRNSLMKKEDFFSTHFWFEDNKQFMEATNKLYEDDKKRTNYDKVSELKRCLFEINKMNEEEINFVSFIQLCLLNSITLNKKHHPQLQFIKKYEDIFYLNN